MMNIGRYEIVKELGRGGMAIVYLARDPFMKRQVAIKVMPKQFTFDPQFRNRFQQEAEVVAALEHDAIVPVYDFGEHEGAPYIVMRYMPGGTLTDRIKRAPLSPVEINALFSRIGPALDRAHRQGVIHRDIKPGNILYDDQGNASISDFGIAKLSEATAAYTGTGGIVGTPAYMSPEQVHGNKKIDGRTDVYALGVVLYESLSGDTPFHADSPMGVALAHVKEPVPRITSQMPNVPVIFETVIQKALAKDAGRRYQSAGQLAMDIYNAVYNPGALQPLPTVQEQPAGTFVERAGTTYIEPAAATYRESPRSTPSAGTPIAAPQPAPKPKSRFKTFTRWVFGVVSVISACLCVSVIGLAATGYLSIPSLNALTIIELIAENAKKIDLSGLEVLEGLPFLPGDDSSQETTVEFDPVGLSMTYIEYILDASGSMLQGMSGKTRLQVAQEVLTSRLNALPSNTQVGLRVYGHRIPYQNREAESCQDIELVVPIRANAAQEIIEWLPDMQALGMTPMSDSIREAANDFTFDSERRNFIVLISDGEETCGDDPAQVVEYLKEIGIDFSIHVIGLDVDAQTANQLSGIATAGGGVYYDARNQEDLEAALGDINNTIFDAITITTTSSLAPSKEDTRDFCRVYQAFVIDIFALFAKYEADLNSDADTAPIIQEGEATFSQYMNELEPVSPDDIRPTVESLATMSMDGIFSSAGVPDAEAQFEKLDNYATANCAVSFQKFGNFQE